MRYRFILCVAAGATMLVGCTAGDHIAAPERTVSAPSAQLLGGLLTAPTSVTPLKRTTALDKPITSSAYIGPLGGTISIPDAGITVLVPALALSSRQLISVTALAGSDVAYEFAPHGLKFPVPLVVTQNLRNTEAASGGLIDPNGLFVGYFTDATRTDLVSELLSVNVSLPLQTAVFTVRHFSGYIVASGRQ